MIKSSTRGQPRPLFRGLAGLLALGLVTAACGDDEVPVVGLVEGFAGVVAADEPRAVVIGRDIIGNGGSAVDAAVAMYFTMTVTLPSRVSLAGGGVCLTLDSQAQEASLIEFLPQAGPSGGVLPLGPRAMAALHARLGIIRWSEVVIPAEGLARFGHEVSRAFAKDLIEARPWLDANPELSALYRTKDGALPKEGERIEQFELSGVLSGIRVKGAGYVYSGEFARRFVEAAAAAGQTITVDELWKAVPEVRAPAKVQFGRRELYFSLPPADNGLLAAELWQLVTEVEDYADENIGLASHLFVEAAMRAFADRDRFLALGTSPDPAEILSEAHLEQVMADYDPARHTPADRLPNPPYPVAEVPYGAGLVAGDQYGNAIACSFTNNGLFGSRRVAPGTGIVMPAVPGPASNGVLAPSVAVYGNVESGEGYSAVAASGGAEAPTALVQVLLGLLALEQDAKSAVARSRLHHGGAPDVVLYEAEVPEPVREALRVRGHRLELKARIGRVNAFHCPNGLTDDVDLCLAASDPRGYGLAATAR
ncbi:MAG: gamma-glutamyltransferase [Pseudomonadota bacterium]